MIKTIQLVALLSSGALVLSACGGSAESDTASGDNVKVVLGTGGADNDSLAYLADSAGIFDKHGIEIETVSVIGAGPVINALTTGDITTAVHTPAVAAQAIEAGTEVQMMCGVMNYNPMQVLAAKDNTSMPSVEEAGDWKTAAAAWKGKTVGVPVLKGSLELAFRVVAGGAGLGEDDIDYVAVGFGPSAVSALETNKIDLLPSIPFQTQQLPDARVLFDFSTDAQELVGNEQYSGYIARADWLADNPDAAAAFCDAITETTEFTQNEANEDEVTSILTEKFGLADDILPSAIEVVRGFSTELECERVQKTVDSAVEMELIKSEHDCADLVWTKP